MELILIEQGVSLLIYGMGTVFVFLTLLVFATKAMSHLVHKFSPETAEDSVPVGGANLEAQDLKEAGSVLLDDIKTAIAQAVRLYRQHH